VLETFDELHYAHLSVAPCLAGYRRMPRLVGIVVQVKIDRGRDIAVNPGLDKAADADRCSGNNTG